MKFKRHLLRLAAFTSDGVGLVITSTKYYDLDM